MAVAWGVCNAYYVNRRFSFSEIISLIFIVYVAGAQISTGTVIVFQLTQKDFVIAADSRATVY
jgi:hypothetical protein